MLSVEKLRIAEDSLKLFALMLFFFAFLKNIDNDDGQGGIPHLYLIIYFTLFQYQSSLYFCCIIYVRTQ